MDYSEYDARARAAGLEVDGAGVVRDKADAAWGGAVALGIGLAMLLAVIIMSCI